MTAMRHSTTITIDGTVTRVRFGEANPEQQLPCQKLAASAWGSYLDEDEVNAREKHLGTQPLARNGSCRTWCLYCADERNRVLSTCKTMRRDLLTRNTQGVDDLNGYCITSVVTALPYRGHGLASHLLQNLAQWLDGPGEAAVSLLYSGIPQFYTSLGWTAFPNTEIILSNGPWLEDLQDAYANMEVRLLVDADLDELCAQDVELLRREVQCTEVTNKENRLIILPTADLVGYQHAFADYMGNLWHCEAPDKRGVAYNDEAWLYWYHDFRGRCLYIQSIHNTIQKKENATDIIAALLLSAFREAEEWNFIKIATWDTSLDVRNALEMLARVSVFKTTVEETRRAQKISVRWRNGEEKTTCTVMANEAYAWNSRN